MIDPRTEYSRRLEHWTAEIGRADRTHLQIAGARLVVAGMTAVLAWLAFVTHAVSPVWPVLLALSFIVIAIVHVRVTERLERARRARELYERGAARLDGTWAGSGPDGARFLDAVPFARDIDLFGPASLFQLLNTARTEAGEQTLAAWLTGAAGIEEIRARQQAVGELKPKIDFREDAAVAAAGSEVGRTDALIRWAAAPTAGLSAAVAFVFAACAAASAILVALVLTERMASAPLLVWLLAQSAVAGLWRRRVRNALARIEVADGDLGLMVALLDRIERETFVAPRLASVSAALQVHGAPASRRIAALRRLVTWLDQASLNLWFRPIGALLLVRSQMAAAIDRWHRTNGPAIEGWVRAVGELEALASLSTYAYEHPADPFPALVETEPLFESAALGHPLLADDVSVRNDLALGGPHPQALIVSGSNMSGKSTLLRAVGVNIVLALAGAPVRATRLTLSPLAIGTTLRVDDSLQEGHSRFYTEILRIRGIVDIARARRPLMFLLDEFFGGTNSHDRRIGAEAIVRALVEAGAIGLVTTHDLALTDLAVLLAPEVVNVHFQDRIENGVLVFDYRMRPGVVERSNALALMRAVGLDV